MKTNSAITLFATAALLLLIIIIYHDYYCSTIYVNARYLHFVLSYEKENEEEAPRTFSWFQSNATAAYMYKHVWPSAYVKVACTHACTRAASKIPCRELHYILLDYINSVDTRACSRDILHAHVGM